ncbi:hypothetical protein [Spirosoma utsteinense]|uniref:Tetratricopeptide repeat protein n=1 Tax=Spirosoma utsteinense TaxID=2585773 RepID=A0ABR6WF15_9BACT|nr:hypothetical protein [Spirosoma utsteinense]MBC3789210.1 hypothetical protein [Spirosoma utsteinense]MBC3795122.1 hypothetical protein [Spirosoma utsteinense]
MTIDVLHPLLHSLTKSEKRYCRLMTGSPTGDKGFLRLLDCLLTHETMDDALTADLTRLFPGATLEPARKYLYRVVMQSLRQFEQDKRIDVRIGQLLHDSQILYERGLAQFSQEQLEKAQRLAEQHERGLYVVLAARQQAEQWVKGQFDGVDEPTLARQHALIRQQVERTLTALHHAALYETLLLRYRTHGTVGNVTDTRRLNDLLLEEHQLLNRQSRSGSPMWSFAMQQQHLHFQSAYFRMIGDEAGSLRVYRELDNLFQNNPTLWAEQPLYYVQLLEGILSDLRMLGQYEDMPYFIDRLRAIDGPTHGLHHTAPYLTLYYRLLLAIDQARYADAATLLATDPLSADGSAFERGLARLTLGTRTEFDLLLVRLQVCLGHLSAALHRLNRVLALPARSLPGRLSMERQLMSLLLHARLGNADYLTYALRSAERKRKTINRQSEGERFILELLRQWLSGRLESTALARIDAFRGSSADQQLIRNLDVRTWASACLHTHPNVGA